MPGASGRRTGDRRRRRRRPGARARAARRPRDRRLRLGHRRQGSPPPRRRGARVERHPAAKDATDLELALDAAIALEPSPDRRRRLGRRPARPPARLGAPPRRRALRGAPRSTRISAMRASTSSAARARSTGTPGDLLTLLPVHGPAEGVTTDGLEYPLRGETLPAGHEPRRLERLLRLRGPHHGRARLPARRPPRPRDARNPCDDLSQGLASCSRCSRRLLAAGCGGSGDSSASKEVVLVTHDSFAIPKAGEGRVRAGERPAAEDPPGRRRRRGRQPGAADEGEPAGRRALRDRQQPALARPRRGALRAVRGEGPRPGRRAPTDSIPTHRVTPIDHGDVCLNVDRKWFASRGIAPPTLARRPHRARATASCSSSRTPPPRPRGSRSCSRTRRPLRRGRLAGLLAPAARERRARRRRLGGGVHAAVLGRRRQQGNAADRRLLRDEPGGGGDLRRRSRPTTAPTAVVAASCFRQVEFAGVLGGAKNVDGAHALIDFMLSERFQAALPESMFVLPVRDGHAAAGRVPPLCRLAGRTRSSCLRPRSARTATAGSTSGRRPSSAERAPGAPPRSLVPAAFVAALLRLPARSRSSSAALTRRRWPLAPDGHRRTALVHDLAGGRLDRCSRSSPACRSRGRSAGSGSAAARSRARSCSCRSSCRRSSSPRRSSRCSRTATSGGIWAILAAHVFFNVAVVTRIVGGAWATIDPASRRGGGRPRRGAVAAGPRGDAAAAGSRPLRVRGADVPLLLHVVRRHPDPRRPRRGRRSRPRSTTARHGCSTCRPRPRSRCSSSEPSRSCWRSRASSRRRAGVAGTLDRASATCCAGRRGRERVALVAVLGARRARARCSRSPSSSTGRSAAGARSSGRRPRSSSSRGRRPSTRSRSRASRR